MGTGIGKNCQRCNDQLDYEDGFNFAETLCSKCEKLTEWELKTPEEKREILEGNQILKEREI